MHFLLALTISAALQVQCYRIKGSENENKPFAPYEKGFVYDGDEIVPAAPTRINQGYESFIVEEGDRRLQRCAGMVGPLEDGKYYCGAKEYGYCDRRSGTCFCNTGYSGASCEECDPNHHRVGALCYKKVMCLNRCSSAGQCDYLTGKCKCNEFREGDDCSVFKCSKYHGQCTHCHQHHCVQCAPGFSVISDAEEGYQCKPCHRFDPRCTSCNSTQCLECTDLLLQSIHRSGRRKDRDPELPPDEVERQFGITIPFGSQQTNAFDEAEVYSLVEQHLTPLQNSSVQCEQGINQDDSFHCYPIEISNIVCGHSGVFSFSSPEYVISEDAVHLRVTIHRSGGGAGSAEVSYGIHHVSTDDADVTPTAFYSISQTLVFSAHEIRKSFLVTIHDDKNVERDEKFQLFLHSPSAESRLGNQWRSMIRIIDEDLDACNVQTTDIQIDINTVTIQNIDDICLSTSYKEQLIILSEDQLNYDILSFTAVPAVHASKGHFELDGNYRPGQYRTQVARIIKGGLKGRYFNDLLLENLEKVRIDSLVNFTWSERVVQSARWDGLVERPLVSNKCCTFFVVGKNVRLWVNRFLIINEWNLKSQNELLLSGYYHFQSEEDIVEITLEVRDIEYASSVKLLWEGSDLNRDIIPSASLYWKDDIVSLEHSVPNDEMM